MYKKEVLRGTSSREMSQPNRISKPLDCVVFTPQESSHPTVHTTSLLAEYAKVKRTARSETVTWMNKDELKGVQVRKIILAQHDVVYQLHHDFHWHTLERVRGFLNTMEVCGVFPPMYVRFVGE